MNLLDVGIIVVLVISAIHGARVGAAIQVGSFAGFLVGIVLGAALVLLIDPHIPGELEKTLVACALLLVPASVLGGAGRRLGAHVWRALRRSHFGVVDALAGTAISIAGALVVCWLFASILVNSSSPTLSGEIEHSKILAGVERVMPPVPDSFASVERYLAASGFPQVLVNVIPEQIGAVKLPSSATVAAAVRLAEPSTVKVVSTGCGDLEEEGSGFVVAPDLVVTNAHVVAGGTHVVVDLSTGRTLVAEPVLFDPKFDLAVLRTTPLGLAPLTIDPGLVGRATQGVTLGFPGGGPFRANPAAVVARADAVGRDIYDTALTVRTVYELDATVRPGDSGGPLISGGEVIGVVFSRSASDTHIGYALASPGVLSRVDEVKDAAKPVSTEGCID